MKTTDGKMRARRTAPMPSVAARKAEGKVRRGKLFSEAPYRSAAERRAEGKRLRDAVPRVEQSGWNPPKKRRDPVELVLAQNEGRVLDLVPIRHGRMLQSPFAFYRGTAAIMAADLAHTPSSGRSGDAAMISGYMGSSRIFDEAICDFAVDYADQAERDYKAFAKAVREGRVKVQVES